MTHKWNYLPITSEQTEASQRLAQELGISPILGELLVERGITTAAAAKKFFRPQLPDLYDPFLMKDMDVAVERLNKAMGKKERILVYGDYDVDGTTAVALVYKFIQQFYSNIDYYIPDRYNEGYGVSTKGVDYATETGVGLIIVLDCGIKAVDEIAYAKEKGIDFIICDHHVPDEVLPPAVAILNAKREDNTYPYEHLSGCGVGFKFMQAFAISNGIEFHHLIPLLDLVGREPHPCLSWLEATQQQSERGVESHYRRMRAGGKRDYRQRHRIQDRSANQRFGTHPKRQGSSRPADGERLLACFGKGRTNQPV